jgi:hypothetical protein
VLAWHSSQGRWISLDFLGEILHDGHMEMIACLENTLVRSVAHPGGGHQALDNMRLIGVRYGGLELAQGCLGCNNVHARGVDLVTPHIA